MNNIFIDVDYAQIYKHGQKIGGDVFLLSRNPDNNQIVSTLSDGLGSGVKANVLASLTAHMAHRLSFSPIDLSHSAKIIMDTLPVCKERKISYSTFTIADIRYAEDMEDIAVNLIEYDNPSSLRFSGPEPVMEYMARLRREECINPSPAFPDLLRSEERGWNAHGISRGHCIERSLN